jgi:hypothetical protein
MELRKSKRYRLSAHAVFCWESSNGILEERAGTTRDICSTGSFIVADSAPPRNAQVQINVYFPSFLGRADTTVELRGEGKIVRVERQGSSVKGFAAELIFQTGSSGGVAELGVDKPQ